MKEALERLELDLRMVKEQLEALNKHEGFAGHPKLKQYLAALKEEEEALEEKKESLTGKMKHYEGLYLWSETINEVCEWLESNLAEYAVENIPELKGKLSFPPVRKLSEEEVKKYSKGLDEIKHNLEESRDFFQASVDGRLQKFHEIEKKIIKVQLEALSKYPLDSPRRQAVEEELKKDLEYVEGNSKENAQVKQRREKMLTLHKNYLKVLKYHTDKLHVLDQPPSSPSYDPQFSFDSGLTKTQVEQLKDI